MCDLPSGSAYSIWPQCSPPFAGSASLHDTCCYAQKERLGAAEAFVILNGIHAETSVLFQIFGINSDVVKINCPLLSMHSMISMFSCTTQSLTYMHMLGQLVL